MVIAHRGAWGPPPQNSLEAFARAIELGCDGIELDVRRTADGRLVVVHDARVGGRPVSGLTRARLRAPLLSEVLDLAAGRIVVDVELKQDGYVEQAMEQIAARLSPDSYVVTSFVDAVLPQVKCACPQARTGLLVGPRLRRRELDGRIRRAAADLLAPHVSLVRRGILTWAAQRGLPAWIWTANDPRALRRLSAAPQVEALITDKPRIALAIVDGRM
ncbi:MAG: glycerophosphodiester phosphodiesterase [Solirubrobacteraceae bacterium]